MNVNCFLDTSEISLQLNGRPGKIPLEYSIIRK